MAFRDKDPNRLKPKSALEKPWPGSCNRKLDSRAPRLVPTLAAQYSNRDTSLLDVATMHTLGAITTSKLKQSSMALTPLPAKLPQPLAINSRAVGLAPTKWHPAPLHRSFPEHPSAPESSSYSGISCTGPCPTARALSTSSSSSQQKLYHSHLRVPFHIYRDDHKDRGKKTTPKRFSSIKSVTGLCESWESKPLTECFIAPSVVQKGGSTQSGVMQSPSSLGASESFDCDQAEILTNDMFNLLFRGDMSQIDEAPGNLEVKGGHVDDSDVSQTARSPSVLVTESVGRRDEQDVYLSTTMTSDILLSNLWADIGHKFKVADLIPNVGPLTRPDYVNIIADYVALKTLDGAESAAYILLFMIRSFKQNLINVRPDGGCYNKVLAGYAAARAPEKAEAIMSLMCALFDEGDMLAQPNTKHYTTLMHAWQRSKRADTPERCERILENMHAMHMTQHLANCKPDAFTYTTVLHSWADSNRPDAPKRAEALFRKMKQHADLGDEGLTPDTVAYSNLINAIISGQGYARAADILWEMVTDFLKGNTKCRPRVRNLNTILAVWSKSKAPYGPERAEELLHRWLHLNQTTEMDVKPDAYSYCLLLKCWSSSNRADAPERAEQTLFWLETLGKQGDRCAKLNSMKYTTVLTAWINRKKWRQANLLFEKMANDYLSGNHEAKPDFLCVQKILDGLCSTSLIQEADSLLRTMWCLPCKNNDFANNSCAKVIKAWGYAGCPERADVLLRDMQNRFSAGRLGSGPSKHLFRLLVGVWEKSKAHDKAARIRAIERMMNRLFPCGAHQQAATGPTKGRKSTENKSVGQRQHD